MFMQGWMKNSAVTNLLSSPGMKLPNTLLTVVLLGKIWGALKIHSMVVSIISKSKFNPVGEEFVGEFNLPTSPLYHL